MVNRRHVLAITPSAGPSPRFATKAGQHHPMDTGLTARRYSRWIITPIAIVSAIVQSSAQTVPQAATGIQAEEIVVTAQRSGIPVWRVAGAHGTVVLVGSIGKVSPGTRWEPSALDAALTQADRIVFPEAMDISFGLFSVIGLIGKWRAQATLPKGQTLQMLTTPEQWARLVALRDQGILKPGFERTHPYHLAMSLARSTRDKRKLVSGADAYVRRYLGRNKGKEISLVKMNLKDVTAEFFISAPRVHVPCLMAQVTLVEAGAAGIRSRAAARDRRSAAWATRRVPEALAARGDQAWRSCWPAGSRMEQERDATLLPTIRNLTSSSQPSLAVVSLDKLAGSGGILDRLVAAGLDVQGPLWK